MTEKKAIVAALDEIALLLRLEGESTHKVHPYEKAARAVERFAGSIPNAIADGFEGIPWIGKSAGVQIADFCRTGRSPLLDALRAEIPEGVRGLALLPGLGPERARRIWRELQILSIDDLESACRENRLAFAAGFGEQAQREIVRAIGAYREEAGLFLLPEAWEAANEVLASFGRSRIEIAGELRRQVELLHEVLFVAEGMPGEESRRSAGGFPVRILRRSREAFEACWLWESASEAHRVSLAARARERGFDFDREGFRKDGLILPFDEGGIYRSLGLEPVHPLLRERPAGETPGALPLIGPESIRGIFHAHTTDSDGASTVEEMVGEAVRLGYEWIGISDHSRNADYANGLSIERLREQGEKVRRIRDRFRTVRIYHGVESDILPDGSLDYPDPVLAELDFVVASIHSSMDMPRDAMTARIEKALRHPATTHWGHPSGRLLLIREAITCDFDRLLEVCAERGVSVEFNAHPYRLDLEWRRIPKAIALGVPISINPDAHALEGLAEPRLRCGTAAKGGLTPAGILNSRSAEEVGRWLSARRRR